MNPHRRQRTKKLPAGHADFPTVEPALTNLARSQKVAFSILMPSTPPHTPRILSGVKPTGRLHIGNYFGMMRPAIEWQDKGDALYFIADYHALTTVHDPAKLRADTRQLAIDFLACGLDPAKATFFKQSDVPEVCELTWLLSVLTPMSLLERCHAYKDAVAKGFAPSHGLFAYPVLMAADILIYDSDIVPVGKDQKQHVEVTRDLAIKMNETYRADLLKLPEPSIMPDLAVIPGLDGQKMSKSYNNTIELFMEEKALRKKIMGIITDSTPVERPKDPATSSSSPSTGSLPTRSRSPRWSMISARAALATAISKSGSLKPSGRTLNPPAPAAPKSSATPVTSMKSCARAPSAPAPSPSRRWDACAKRSA